MSELFLGLPYWGWFIIFLFLVAGKQLDGIDERLRHLERLNWLDQQDDDA